MSVVSTVYLLLADEPRKCSQVVEAVQAALPSHAAGMTKVSSMLGGSKRCQHECWGGSYNHVDHKAVVAAFKQAIGGLTFEEEARMMIWEEEDRLTIYTAHDSDTILVEMYP